VLARDSLWEKSELLTVVFYLRLVIATSAAVLFGLTRWGTGAGVIVTYGVLTSLLPTIVLRKYLRVYLESYDENMAWFCFTENLWPSFLLFILIWTLVFTWRVTRTAESLSAT
jgi:hypothetical protein